MPQGRKLSGRMRFALSQRPGKLVSCYLSLCYGQPDIILRPKSLNLSAAKVAPLIFEFNRVRYRVSRFLFEKGRIFMGFLQFFDEQTN